MQSLFRGRIPVFSVFFPFEPSPSIESEIHSFSFFFPFSNQFSPRFDGRISLFFPVCTPTNWTSKASHVYLLLRRGFLSRASGEKKRQFNTTNPELTHLISRAPFLQNFPPQGWKDELANRRNHATFESRLDFPQSKNSLLHPTHLFIYLCRRFMFFALRVLNHVTLHFISSNRYCCSLFVFNAVIYLKPL